MEANLFTKVKATIVATNCNLLQLRRCNGYHYTKLTISILGPIVKIEKTVIKNPHDNNENIIVARILVKDKNNTVSYYATEAGSLPVVLSKQHINKLCHVTTNTGKKFITIAKSDNSNIKRLNKATFKTIK